MKPNRFRDAFRAFPAVLQHQILLRLGMALGSMLFFVFCWLLFGQFVFASPFLLLAGWMGFSGIQMLGAIARGRFTCVRGTCRQIITTVILKRPKTLILSTGQGDVQVRMQQRIKKPEIGVDYILYLADDTTVYQSEDGFIVSSYYALARSSQGTV